MPGTPAALQAVLNIVLSDLADRLSLLLAMIDNSPTGPAAMIAASSGSTDRNPRAVLLGVDSDNAVADMLFAEFGGIDPTLPTTRYCGQSFTAYWAGYM